MLTCGIAGCLHGGDILAGASMIQVGCGNFVDPHTSVKIVDGLGAYLKEQNLAKITDLMGRLETN